MGIGKTAVSGFAALTPTNEISPRAAKPLRRDAVLLQQFAELPALDLRLACRSGHVAAGGLQQAREIGAFEGRDRARFVMMVGDQIYADMLNRHVPLGLADTFEEFQERYHTAFGSLHMRRLLRQMPTYMILDDHEIEDNWTQDRILKAEHRRVFNLAIGAYRSYQWVHGPDCFDSRQAPA